MREKRGERGEARAGEIELELEIEIELDNSK